MRKIIFLALVAFFLMGNGHTTQLDSLYRAIDTEIANAGAYQEKKHARLDALRHRIATARTPQERFDAELALYDEYSSFKNDSAIACLDRCIALAGPMQRNDLKTQCLIKIAMQHSVAGFYGEALDYLRDVPRNQLQGPLLSEYYNAYRHVYGELGSYTQDNILREEYFGKSVLYRDSLMAIIPKDSELYLSCLESRLLSEHDYAAAMRVNDQRMSLVQPGTHEFAIVAYFRALNFGGLGDMENQKICFAQSALSDIQNSVMDQASLWSLAAILNQEGDIDRSYRYVEYSWACTSHFSAHVRSWLVSPVLTMINSGYKERLRQTNNRLWVMLGLISLLALAVAGLYLYVSRKRHQLATARNELRRSNEQLSEANSRLSQANDQLSLANDKLSSLNAQLSEANRIKDEYIGQFFNICTDYVNKLDQFRIKINRKVKARQFDEIVSLTQSGSMKMRELEELNANFDSIFIRLFPTFVEDFNGLLQPDQRIEQPDDMRLPTPIRIFALIRLGIDDSYHISQFLHFSPNTVYNYRSRMKGKAIDRDTFEENVKRLCLHE